MQALSTSVFLCYAAADRATATAIAAFLERGADVRVYLGEGELRPGEDLAAKAREGRMADVVLVLFSRESMPSRWPRAQWEDALVHEPAEEGVRIGFIRCDDCIPPKVLTPRFELAGRAVSGLRGVKRWVRNRTATYIPPADPPFEGSEVDLELAGIAIADRPGSDTIEDVAMAFEFVRAFREDFDEVLHVECSGRPLSAIAGDLGIQLGLRLEGELEDNLERLREFCSARRFLLLLEGVDPDHDLLPFGGRCSVLAVTGCPARPTDDPLRHAQHAFLHRQSTTDWTELCQLARMGRRLTRGEGRIAECYELMQQWYSAAKVHGDRAALEESARELVWILEGWGRTEEAERLEHWRASEFDEQMPLF